MQTIGERLEEARKRKGISVREAAEATKIRSDYLQKFEANAFDLDLPSLYIRGFVRNYARFLELDQERFIAEYDSVAVTEGRTPRRTDSRENYGRVEFTENSEAGAGKRGGVDQAMLFKYALYGGGALAVLAVIALIINFFSSSTPSKPAPAAPTAQTAIVQPAADSAQTLTLTAVENTNIKVVQDSDKHVIFAGVLAKGELRSFRKTGKILITTEKGSNLRMEVNGRNYPVPLDGYGRFALD